MRTVNSSDGRQIWRPTRSEHPNYPWHIWLDGRTWELIPGQDYVGNTSAFRARCYYMAKELGHAVRTRWLNDHLYIQAINKDTGEPLLEPPGGYLEF